MKTNSRRIESETHGKAELYWDGKTYQIYYENQWGDTIPCGERSTAKAARSLAKRYSTGRDSRA